MDPLLLLIPVYDDWDVVPALLRALESTFEEHGLEAAVLLVDDGSARSFEDAPALPSLVRLGPVEVLELKRNLGHQRAIAVALSHVHEHRPARTVVLMDGDGEDDPRDVPRLLERFTAHEGRRVIFAARHKRSENWRFQIFYRLYQALHLLLTGRGVRVGNFSVVPARAVARLVVTSEIWNHYAAAVFNSRIAYDTVPTARAKRLGAHSRMNFTALVAHGLSALSVYGPAIGVRLLSALFVLTLAAGTGLAAAAVLSLARGWTVAPAVFLGGALLLVVLVQTLFAGALFVFLLLSGRQGTSFIPARDYHHFVARVASFEDGPR